ncbi:MAG: dihydropteroate synthase [Nitrospinaceae bacterium]|mgnify:FL=1|jgi:dihydropteroate synthase|nr:dihydropteroate synthase [Nitrospinaceae bacterium]
MSFSFDQLVESGSVAVMGIINLSPDSFYAGNRCATVEDAVRHAENMVEEGAHVLDVGAESTRPGSQAIGEEIELKRLAPVISALVKRVPVPVSVDTSKPAVADRVLQEGAQLINDVAGLNHPEMSRIIARHDAGVVVMHMQGAPETMQDNPQYGDVVEDVLEFLRLSVETAGSAGIAPRSIAVDPGIGFGKTLEHNLKLIGSLRRFKALDKPVLIGVSRKSFIGRILDLDAEERLEGSLAAGVAGVINGADILRVHDVRATVRAVRIAHAIREGGR